MPDQIFISYRRDDAAYVTGHINELLRKEFGDESVFTDVDNIALGADFRAVLEETVGRCQVFLAVIGDGWLTIRDQDGKQRLQDPADFVRIEIESALKRNIPIIPLLVGGAKMPTAEELPDSLQDLAFRNGTQIRPAPDFGVDMDRLIRNLRRHLDSIRDDSGKEQKTESATKTDQGGEPQRERSRTGSDSQRDAEADRSEISQVKLRVEEDERARKQVEFGTGPDQARKPWTARLWLVVILIAAGASWYYANQNQETIQAVLTAIQTATSDAEEDLEAADNADTGRMDEAGEDSAAEPDVTATAGDDAEAIPRPDAATAGNLTADVSSETAEDAEANLTENVDIPPDQVVDTEVILTPGTQRQADASTLISEGTSLAALGDHEAAIRIFDEAVQLHTQPAFVYKQRAASYFALGEYEAAIKDYDEAIQLNAEDINAHYNRGASHFALQDHAAAIADYDAVIQLDPEFIDAYSKRADAHEAMGNVEAAVRDRAVVTVFDSNRDNPR